MLGSHSSRLLARNYAHRVYAAITAVAITVRVITSPRAGTCARYRVTFIFPRRSRDEHRCPRRKDDWPLETDLHPEAYTRRLANKMKTRQARNSRRNQAPLSLFSSREFSFDERFINVRESRWMQILGYSQAVTLIRPRA